MNVVSDIRMIMTSVTTRVAVGLGVSSAFMNVP